MKVSELSALRIENTALKIQQLQTTAQAIYAEQLRHIEDARKEVEAPVHFLYNADLQTFQAPPETDVT